MKDQAGTTRRAAIPAGDLIAGLSVALVLIPQSLAYAEQAGITAAYGLYAAAFAPIAAAFFASSPFLQTGPTALMSLLTLGVLSTTFAPGSAAFLTAASLLALLVGGLRVGLGLLKLGGVAYFLSQPVLKGFTTGAAILILFSQLPAALGVSEKSRHVFGAAAQALLHPEGWHVSSALLALITLLIVMGGARLSARFPGALVAVVVGLGSSVLFGLEGPQVGTIALGFPSPPTRIPWPALPDLLLGAAVIAVVGFAEPAAIARTFAHSQTGRWNPNRELIGQGVANLASGLAGAFPVGGSFSRSSLNKLAGATTRWSGLLTGVTVLVFVPFARVLAPLPQAVLAAIVIAAVARLIDIRGLVDLWHYAKLQSLTAYATLLLTLLLAPRVDFAVLLGIGLAVVAHLYREAELGFNVRLEGDTAHVILAGVLWFGSAHRFEEKFERFLETSAPAVSHIIIDASALGRVDLSGSLLLAELIGRTEAHGLSVELTGLKPYMQRVLERIQRHEGE